jgi:hypothetical protein
MIVGFWGNQEPNHNVSLELTWGIGDLENALCEDCYKDLIFLSVQLN